MKRKMIATLAVMSICLCSCQKNGLVESPQTTTVQTPTVAPTTETKATSTPEAETAKTSAPQKTPTSEQSTQTGKLLLSTKDSIKNFSNVIPLTLSDSTNADFILHTNATLKSVTVNTVNYNMETCKIERKEYEAAELKSTDAIHIKTYIPDQCSNLLITYQTSNNNTVYKLVSYDLRGDGPTNVILEDIDSSKIQS